MKLVSTLFAFCSTRFPLFCVPTLCVEISWESFRAWCLRKKGRVLELHLIFLIARYSLAFCMFIDKVVHIWRGKKKLFIPINHFKNTFLNTCCVYSLPFLFTIRRGILKAFYLNFMFPRSFFLLLCFVRILVWILAANPEQKKLKNSKMSRGGWAKNGFEIPGVNG